MSGATTLYRFYNGKSRLLYVGITDSLGRRLPQHGSSQPWWEDVARVEVSHFSSRRPAEAAEREAIQKENPLHNVVFNTSTGSMWDDPLRWKCGRCKKVVNPGDGYIATDVKEAFVRSESGASPTDLVGWLVWHADCDPNPTGSSFRLPISELSSFAGLLTTSVRLLDAVWLRATDWDRVIFRAVAQLRTRQGLREQT